MDEIRGEFTYKGQNLVIEQPVIEYLSSLDPEFEWRRRGLKASTYTYKDEERTQEAIRKRLDSEYVDGEYDEEIENFKDESLRYFELIRGERYEYLRDQLPGESFYVIIGAPRTGGTYILKELLRAQGRDIRSMNFKMVSDKMPVGHFINEDNRTRIIFDLAQWLTWASREFKSNRVVPKKHLGFSYFLPLIDKIFGDRAEYVLTIRHPGEAFKSYRDRFFPENYRNHSFTINSWKTCVMSRSNIEEEVWSELEWKSKFLLFWQTTYDEILDNVPDQRAKGMKFGTNYEQFLDDFSEQWIDTEFTPESFNPTDRELEPYWKSEYADQHIEPIVRRWKNRFGIEPF